MRARSWVIGEKGAEFRGQFGNFGFNYVGNLEGTGTLKITNTGDNNWGQNYVRFKGNPSGFAGSIDMTGSTYRLILAPSKAGAAEQWKNIVDERPMIHVSGVTAQIADGKTWTAPVVGMRGSGRCEVMVGDADDNFAPGEYTMTVSVGGWHKNLNFTLAIGNDGNLATVGGVGCKTMQEAVAAGGTIKLLTNVFLAAPEGTYAITRNGFDVKTTNYTTIDALTNKVTAEDEVVFERDGEGVTRVVIAGEWLAAGLPWRTKKAIDAAIWTTGETMAPFEAYVLGFGAEDALTAKVIARGVQTADPNTIELTDGLTIKDAAETGVVVTKKLVDTETKGEASATTVYDLSQMGEKAKLLRIGYSFTPDLKPDPEQN